MANLDLNLDVDLLLNTDRVTVDTNNLRQKATRVLNSALSGVKFTGQRIKFAPQLELDESSFRRFKSRIQAQAADILQALNIVQGGGVVPGDASTRARRLASTISEADLRLLNDAARVTEDLITRQRRYARIVNETQDIFERSLKDSTSLNRQEIQALQRRASLLRQLQTAQSAAQPFTRSRDIFTSEGEQVRLQALNLDQLRTATRNTASEMRRLNRVLDPEAYEKASKAAEQFAERQNRIFARQPTTPAEAAARLRDVAQQRGVLEGRRRGADTSGLEEIDRQLASLGQREQVIRNLRRGFNGLNTELGPLNQNLSQTSLLLRQFFRFAIGYGVLFEALNAVRALATGIIDLDRALFSIQAITASTQEQMANISGAIRQVAVDTKFTTSEVAQAAQVLAQAGVDPNQINSVLEGVATFAAGTQTSIETAAGLVTTMRNVFDDLDDITIADQLTRVLNISRATGQDLETILGISAQTAEQFNLTSEQFLGAVGTLRDAGLRASTVATGLRQGLLELFTPSASTVKDLQKRYEEIGDQLGADEIRARFFGFTQEANPLLALLRELNRLGFAGAGRETLARSINVRGANAIVALLENINDLEQAQSRLVGTNAALDASDTQLQSLSNSVSVLGAAMTVLASDITQGPVRSLEDMVDSVTEAVQALNDLQIASVAAGGEGLLPALQLGGAGAIGGFLAGRTPGQRALGAAVGGAGGAFAGAELAESEDPQLAANLADAAFFAVTVIPLLSTLGRAVSGSLSFLRGGTGVAAAATATVAATRASTFLSALFNIFNRIALSLGAVIGIFTASGLRNLPGLISGLGTRLIPFVGWVFTAFQVLDAIFDITDDGQEDLEALRRRAQGSQRQQLRATQVREQLEQQLRGFQFTDEATGVRAQRGQLAEQLENLQILGNEFQEGVNNLFGELTEQQLEQLREQFLILATTGAEIGSVERTQALDNISQITDTTLEGLTGAQQEIFRSVENGLSQFTNGVIGQVQDFNQRIQRIRDQQLAGENLRPIDQAFITEVERLFGEDVELARGIRAEDIGDLGVGEVLDAIQGVYRRTGENAREIAGLVTRQEEENAAITNRIQAELRAAIVDPAVSGAQLQDIVSRLIGSLTNAGVLTAGYLEDIGQAIQSLESDLERRREEVQAELAQQQEIPAVQDLSPVELERAARLGATRQFRNQDNINALQQELDNVNSRIEAGTQILTDVAEATTDLAEGIQQRNEDTLNQIRLVIGQVAEDATDIAVDLEADLAIDAPVRELFNKMVEAAASGVEGIDIQQLVGTGLTEEGEITTPRAFERLQEDLRNRLASAQVTSGRTEGTATGGRGRGRPTQEAFIQDPGVARRLARLDIEIENAQKTNLEKLVDLGNATNPVIEKRNLLSLELGREIAIQRRNIDAIEGFSFDSEKERREAVGRAQSRLATLEIRRFRIEADAERTVNEARRRLDRRRLQIQERAIQAEQKALDNQLESAVEVGDIQQLGELQQQRLGLAEQLVDNEESQLSLQEDNEETVSQIIDARRRELSASEAVARAQEDFAASQQRLRFAQGEFTTGDAVTDAFQEAIGQTRTREQLSANLSPQIRQTREEIDRLTESLENEAQLYGETSPAIRQRREDIEQLTISLAQLTGQFQTLTQQATEGFQFSQIFDPGTLIEQFQQLDSDITNLARNIQGEFVQAIDSIGETLVDSLLKGEDFVTSFRVILADMFRNIAVDFSQTLINQAAQGLFGAFLPAGTPEEQQQQATVDNTAATVELTAAIRQSIGAGGTGTLAGVPAAGVGGGSRGILGGIADFFTGANKGTSDAVTQAAETQVQATQNAAQQQVNATQQQTQQTGGFFQSLASTFGGLLSSLIGSLFSGGGSGGGTASSIVSLIGSFFAASKGAAKVSVSKFGRGISRLRTRTFSEGSPGVISGPGTGTSDSIPGLAIGKQVAAPILVSNGESILTAKATDFLGTNFINKINNGLSPVGFANGKIFDRIRNNINQRESGAEKITNGMSETMANQPTSQLEPSALNVTLIDDRKSVEDVMTSPTGRKAVMAHIARNAKTVSSYLR